jgi:hypothetical protein
MQIEGQGMKYRSHVSIVAIGVIFIVSPANATNIGCPGVVAPYVGIDGSGVVLTTIENAGTISICSVSTTMGGVTPSTCQAWYSTILTHRTLGKRLTYYFDTNNPTNTSVTTCASLGNWTTHVPYFVELN